MWTVENSSNTDGVKEACLQSYEACGYRESGPGGNPVSEIGREYFSKQTQISSKFWLSHVRHVIVELILYSFTRNTKVCACPLCKICGQGMHRLLRTNCTLHKVHPFWNLLCLRTGHVED